MRALLLSVIALFTMTVAAVEPEAWKVTSTEEFLAGEMEGFAISATGELLPGPAVKKLSDLEEPFVLSQVTGNDGTIYLGTGNDGKVFRLKNGKLDVLLDADEQQIHALAIDGDHLFAGSSPHGRIYRIDTRNGSSESWVEIEQAYIWDIEPIGKDGLVVATGLEGKLLLVKGKDQSSVLFDAPELHLRSIAVRGDGAILAGGSGEGRIYEVTRDGRARALYDSSLTEISALYFDSRTGTTWAGGGKSVLPTTPPQQQQQQQQQAASGQQGSANSGETSGQPSVSVSFSFDNQQGAITQPTGSSELYRVHPDGYVETVWRLEREIIYSIDRDAQSQGIVISTGANGRIYRVVDDRVELVAELPEKQVVSYRADGGRAIATTTNSGAVFELDFSSVGKASFQSDVKDTRRLSRFGEYTIDGQSIPKDIAIAYRSGNTSTPDETWSEWSNSKGPDGVIGAPNARFLQWKIELDRPTSGIAIEEVSSVFVNHNVAPKIESFGLAEPAVVLISGGYPTAPGIVEATNPDQYGIFNSIDNPSQQENVKKYFRKGYRTVNWKTSDENSDELLHDLEFRPRGVNEWLRLREKIRGDQMNFDTTQLPDGEYELKLTVRDELGNPTNSMTAERAGLFMTVDNSAPLIRAAKRGGDVTLTITDAASPVTKVEYSVDAEEWVQLLPQDGISDSRSETYVLSSSDIDGRFVIVRAVDAFYNVAAVSID